jgi:hypothetical protein
MPTLKAKDKATAKAATAKATKEKSTAKEPAAKDTAAKEPAAKVKAKKKAKAKAVPTLAGKAPETRPAAVAAAASAMEIEDAVTTSSKVKKGEQSAMLGWMKYNAEKNDKIANALKAIVRNVLLRIIYIYISPSSDIQ